MFSRPYLIHNSWLAFDYWHPLIPQMVDCCDFAEDRDYMILVDLEYYIGIHRKYKLHTRQYDEYMLRRNWWTPYFHSVLCNHTRVQGKPSGWKHVLRLDWDALPYQYVKDACSTTKSVFRTANGEPESGRMVEEPIMCISAEWCQVFFFTFLLFEFGGGFLTLYRVSMLDFIWDENSKNSICSGMAC